jgi:hypothetical protein
MTDLVLCMQPKQWLRLKLCVSRQSGGCYNLKHAVNDFMQLCIQQMNSTSQVRPCNRRPQIAGCLYCCKLLTQGTGRSAPAAAPLQAWASCRAQPAGSKVNCWFGLQAAKCAELCMMWQRTTWCDTSTAQAINSPTLRVTHHLYYMSPCNCQRTVLNIHLPNRCLTPELAPCAARPSN